MRRCEYGNDYNAKKSEFGYVKMFCNKHIQTNIFKHIKIIILYIDLSEIKKHLLGMDVIPAKLCKLPSVVSSMVNRDPYKYAAELVVSAVGQVLYSTL